MDVTANAGRRLKHYLGLLDEATANDDHRAQTIERLRGRLLQVTRERDAYRREVCRLRGQS